MGGGFLRPDMSRLISTTVPRHLLAGAEPKGYQSGLAKLMRSRPCGRQRVGSRVLPSPSLLQHAGRHTAPQCMTQG